MDKFTVLEGVAAPLKVVNVDTDMIIPKQYLKTIKRTGLGKALFSEQRYREDGSENPDFVLNKPAYRNAKILVAGDNFGCGSSREHAPWALLDFGIRCVISTSFADIFYNNCFKNGILPIKVKPDELEKLFEDAERGANATLTIDLEKQEIRGPDGGTITFEIDPFRKHCLLNGLDDIGLTTVSSRRSAPRGPGSKRFRRRRRYFDRHQFSDLMLPRKRKPSGPSGSKTAPAPSGSSESGKGWSATSSSGVRWPTSTVFVPAGGFSASRRRVAAIISPTPPPA